MKLICGNYTIIFDLNPGVYTDWSSNSATGKTFTATLLQGLISRGNNDILVITYSTVSVAGVDKFIDMINKGSYKLIFVDRADMYLTDELYNSLLKSGAIVYLDVKQNIVNESYYGDECHMDFNMREVRYYVDTF